MPTDVLPKPYYQDEAVTIYHGDCRELLPMMPKVDLVLTDPPYGVGFKYESHDDTNEGYDDWCKEWFEALKKTKPQTIAVSCGLSNITKWEKPTWVLAWHKPASMGRCVVGFNNWEPVLIYGKPKKQIVDVFKAVIKPDKSLEGHPCPKPLGWGLWLVENLAPQGGIILDPFMGSGTTLRAAKDLGRKAIGIEIEEKYCEIAAKRMAQEVLL
jgi:site-specific DNA-methyltransferase (adenine-specific)